MRKISLFVTGVLLGGGAGIAAGKKLNSNDVEQKRADKFKLYYNVLNQWMYLKHNNRNLSEYFKRKKYKRIGIYGLGELGNRLIDELRDTETEVVYGVDKGMGSTFGIVPSFSLEEIQNITEDIDVMVVTPVFAYSEVADGLRDKVNCEIISIEDVVFDM